MNILKDEKKQKILLFIFLIIQPILDCYILYTDKIISIFKFSPTTIIRLVFIFIMCLFIFLGKTSKKNKIIITIYMIIVAIYSGIHIIYDLNLPISNYKVFSFNIISEVFYIIRMLLPFGVAFLAYSIKFSKKEFMHVIYGVLLLTSSIIVISNIFSISLASYGNGIIKGNIFNWFFNKNNYGVLDLASKGWFNSANQISGLFMLLLPIAIYSLLEEFNKYKVFAILITCIAMIMLGTRVASSGFALNIIFMLIVEFILVLIWKKNINLKSYISLGIILIIGGVILTKAPVVSQILGDYYNKNDIESYDEINNIVNQFDDDTENPNEDNKNDKDNISIAYLVTKLSINRIYYTKVYPVQEHEDFWREFIFEIPTEKKFGQRNIELLIIKDIDKKQHQKLTPILGYGYSRFTNAYLYLEQDFYVHYYTIGLVGTILLLSPYIIISLICSLYMLLKKKVDFLGVAMVISLTEVVAISYISGHIVDELIVTLYMGFILGYLIKRTEMKKNETED